MFVISFDKQGSIEIKGSKPMSHIAQIDVFVKLHTEYYHEVSPNSVGMLAYWDFHVVKTMYSKNEVDISDDVLIGVYKKFTEYSFFIKDETERYYFSNCDYVLSIA